MLARRGDNSDGDIGPARRQRVCLAALTLLTLSLGCGTCRAEADEVLTLTHQGIARTAVVHTPAGMPDGPAPLVIGLYGHLGTIESFRDWLHLDVTADREHFLVVYPEAVDRDWSYGRPIVKPMPAVDGEPVDDVGFIRAIIDNLTASKRVDASRIYVTGVSRGALMTYTLACALADRIAAAVPIVSGMTEYQREDCHPVKRVPLMVVAGTNDRVQMYDGWLAPAGRLLSVAETMDYWRVHNGCRGQEGEDVPHRERADPKRERPDPTRIWLFRWTGCQDGTRLLLYRVNGGGHQVPSFTQNSEEQAKKMGLRNRDIETADEVWSFVKEFTR
jgi:polyhydroxybutyrate depolymerase